MSFNKLIFCPTCGLIQQPTVNNPRFSLPPTGGDYEWVETSTMVSCCECKHEFEIRIQINIETGNFNQVSYFPYPDNPSLLIYTMIHKYLMDKYFYILKITDSLASLNQIHQNFQCKNPNENNVLMAKINSEGVWKIDDQLIYKREKYDSLSYPIYPMGFVY